MRGEENPIQQTKVQRFSFAYLLTIIAKKNGTYSFEGYGERMLYAKQLTLYFSIYFQALLNCHHKAMQI